MSLLRGDSCDKGKNNCNNCVCDQLKKLEPGTPVFVRTTAGGLKSSIKGRFLCFDLDSCCVTFTEEVFEEEITTIIDCRNIVSLSVTNEQFMDNMREIMRRLYNGINGFNA
ncbi:hypothetical protein [Pseudalkalibacillus berkeleyi]|uniref:Uncharacterized protein n=1 Tax=Pseudalkalibacillus berkeleyi TaxID=1069813 RepID=A0ABS9H054_9BACL|nr:hypothetical protein [Pseudalkalibacillus berkeleyi]MCF6137225.1 hypothetical protein [Pseudalkalibacillus berkeleyi]